MTSDVTPRPDLVALLGRARAWQFAVPISGVALVIVSLFSLAYHGEVQQQFLVTGGFTAFVLTVLVVKLTRIYQHRLEGEIARREAAERAHTDLIARLQHTLALEREIAAMRVREEKLRTLRLTMSKVQHHLNNLANNLQLVEVEYEHARSLSPETLDALHSAVHESAHEMSALAEVEDPFNEESFRVKV